MKMDLCQGLLPVVSVSCLSISRVHAGLDGTGNLALILSMAGLTQPEPGAHPSSAPNCCA